MNCPKCGVDDIAAHKRKMKFGPREKRLVVLIAEYQRALTLRDGGVEAKKVWLKIKRIASLAEQVRILESTR